MPFPPQNQPPHNGEAKHPSLSKDHKKKPKGKHDPIKKASASYLRKSKQQPYRSKLAQMQPQQPPPAQAPAFLPDQYPVGQ